MSGDSGGLKKGLVDAKRAILDIFLTLDDGDRREVVHVLEGILSYSCTDKK